MKAFSHKALGITILASALSVGWGWSASAEDMITLDTCYQRTEIKKCDAKGNCVVVQVIVVEVPCP